MSDASAPTPPVSPLTYLRQGESLGWPIFAFDLDLLSQQLNCSRTEALRRVSVHRAQLHDALWTTLLGVLHG